MIPRPLARTRIALLGLALPLAVGCASSPATAQQSTTQATNPVAQPTGQRSDSTLLAGDSLAANGLPTGYGSLRQDDVAIKMQVGGKQVKLIPLDERVLRTMSPDSYRALRGVLESRRAQIADLASRTGRREYSVWYVSYYGIDTDARYSARDLTLTSTGREYRPVEVLPLSSGFGEERLRARQVQTALYLFEAGIDLGQPITVTVEGTRNEQWGETVRLIERERSLIRSRAGRAGG